MTPIMLALVVRYEALAGAPTIITYSVMSLGGSTLLKVMGLRHFVKSSKQSQGCNTIIPA